MLNWFNYLDYFISVAVHIADPMVVSSYNAGITPLISGYPNAIVNRIESINPTNLNEAFLQ